jgi:SOS-response transcriptional repressor LexA
MIGLTARQRQLLEFVASRFSSSEHAAPTYQEIADHLGMVSKNAVNCHLLAISRKGFIERPNRKARSIKLTEAGWKQVGGAPNGASYPAAAPSNGHSKMLAPVLALALQLSPTDKTRLAAAVLRSITATEVR